MVYRSITWALHIIVSEAPFGSQCACIAYTGFKNITSLTNPIWQCGVGRKIKKCNFSLLHSLMFPLFPTFVTEPVNTYSILIDFYSSLNLSDLWSIDFCNQREMKYGVVLTETFVAPSSCLSDGVHMHVQLLKL